MTAASLGASLLAGILSTLSPCVLPLLPLVVGAAASAHRLGAVCLAAGVAIAFTAAGLFVATVGFAIGLDGDVLRSGAAIVLGLAGLLLLSPLAQARLSLAGGGVSDAGDRLIRRLPWNGATGQFCTGLLLGLVWSPCVGPTLGAASLLASRGKDLASVTLVMLAFGIGTTLPLLLVAGVSRQLVQRWRGRMLAAGRGGRRVLGVCALLLAVMILTGADRRLETVLVEASPGWLTDLTTKF